MKKELLVNVSLRILATFAASGLGVIGAGTIAGVPVLKAVFMAGIAGVATAYFLLKKDIYLLLQNSECFH